MTNYTSIGQSSDDHVLVASTVDTVTFTAHQYAYVEVECSGSAAVFFTVDGSTPAVDGPASYEIPAAASPISRVVPNQHSGSTTVKVISAGTPTYSVTCADERLDLSPA